MAERLRRQRGHIKASITISIKILDEGDTNPDDRDTYLLRSSYDSMKMAFEKFESIQDELEDLEESEADNRMEIIELHDRTRARVEKILDKLVVKEQPSIAQPINQAQATLPTIALPTFDGSIEKWASFFSIFTSLIDQQAIDMFKKLQYLRLSLTGKAANAIESLETIGSNYSVALSILKEKFECNRLALRRHWAILREFPRLSKDTPEALSNLVDIFHQHLRALENLKAPVSSWDIPLVDLILSKLNSNTRWQWEMTLNDDIPPSYIQLLKFFEKRANCAEFSSNESMKFAKIEFDTSRKINVQNKNNRSHTLITQTNIDHTRSRSTIMCPICAESHRLFTCTKFRELSVDERKGIIKNAHLCFNCFGKGHGIKECISKSRCQKCSGRHNTLLHVSREAEQTNVPISYKPTTTTMATTTRRQLETKAENSIPSDIMVTATLYVLDKTKNPLQCRGLLDTCSTNNFMTEELVDRLKLKRQKCQIPVGALNAMTTYSKEVVVVTIKSRVSNYEKSLTFLIIPTISKATPDQLIPRGYINIPANIKLADPKFHQPAPIDILLGAGTSLSVLSIGQIKLTLPEKQQIYVQKTRLGWIIGGATPIIRHAPKRTCNLITSTEFDLRRFWEIEEISNENAFTDEETLCEEHFKKHVSRDRNGRYVVALPFNRKLSNLGSSYHVASRRYEYLTRKLSLDPQMKAQYEKVLNEYLSLGHMSPVSDNNTEEGNCYYLPHHAVIKETSMTTKLRVVFDGSVKSTSGMSLNDTLMVGPTIQPSLTDQLIRFRIHPIVLTGDIEKMYRQFLIRKEDRRYQRIIWKNKEGKPQIYELNTATFGTSSAPFLAIRCLHQLADDESHQYPIAANILKRDFYVDDLLTGTKTTQEARVIRDQLSSILCKGGLRIRQWASNDYSILQGLPRDEINQHLQIGDTSTVKTLGIHWNAATDEIIYSVNPSKQEKITKRTILAETARIFDPLGILAPVIIVAKIMIQKLWQLKVHWDESLPSNIHTEWLTYYNQFNALNNLSFSRTIMKANVKEIQLHGFADASEKAYGACLYI